MSADNPHSTQELRLWENGWQDHQFQQRRRMAALTLVQKLEWLEEAQRVVEHLAKSREKLHEANAGMSNAGKHQ